MTENRIDDLMHVDPDDLEGEDAAIAKLAQLAKAHGAESRAADVIADRALRGRFRYAPGLEWLEWCGGKWDTDEVGRERVHEVVRQFIDTTERDYRAEEAAAKATADGIAETVMARIAEEDKVDAKGIPRDPAELFALTASDIEKTELENARREAAQAKAQADMWLNLLSSSKITSVTKLCRGMDGILTRASSFDAQNDLLNVENGVVDLRTGELLAHDPDLLMTHMAGGPYRPGARHIRWDQALQAIPEGVREWFQDRMGQTFTGHTPDDDSLVVAEGGGENGKSAIMLAVDRAIGSYGRLISHRVLIAQPGQHPTEMMTLRGLRFALLEETPEEGHLDTHQLKTTIGTPQITARRMRRDDVTFTTTHSLWINTNYLPQVDTTDHGTWRRLKAIPFPYRFLKPGQEVIDPNDRQGDLTLKPALRDEDGIPEAVIAWAVEGAMRWYGRGRIIGEDPPMVLAATERWRSGSDVAYLFATENLVKDETAYITAEEMRKAFGEFLEQQGKRPWSAKTLNTRLPDAMAAAKVQAATDPTKTATVRATETASKWSENPHEGSWGPGWSSSREAATTLKAGDKARIWRGVRFATTTERREGLTTLRAV